MKTRNSVSNMVKKKLKLSKVKKLISKKNDRLIQRQRALKSLCKNRGVVYINHIPHGFYEEELYKYFTQFGVVTAVKVPRSNKTGRSKGYAFVEFQDKEVAQVAADAMNNYLMFDCLIQTKYLPPREQKPIAFDRTGKPWVNRSPTFAADLRRKKDKLLKEKAASDVKEFAKKAKRCVNGLHKKLVSKTGIDYEFQINDDAQLLKVTKKPEDEKPSTSKVKEVLKDTTKKVLKNTTKNVKTTAKKVKKVKV